MLRLSSPQYPITILFCFCLPFLSTTSFFHMAIFYRDIPMPLVTSGVEHGNLRELALARMKDLGTEVSDILSLNLIHIDLCVYLIFLKYLTLFVSSFSIGTRMVYSN